MARILIMGRPPHYRPCIPLCCAWVKAIKDKYLILNDMSKQMADNMISIIADIVRPVSTEVDGPLGIQRITALCLRRNCSSSCVCSSGRILSF